MQMLRTRSEAGRLTVALVTAMATVVLLPAAGSAQTTTYLSDRAWTSATNDYGPVELDRSNGEDLAGDGVPIRLNGTAYTKGLGVHARSELRYALGASCSLFSAVVGIDDEVGANGSVAFQVWSD